MSDEQLIERYKNGDDTAREQLLEKYDDKVHAIARRFFLNGGEAEDLVQEGRVGLCSAISTYDGKSASFSTYAYSCIRNKILDAVKSNRNGKNAPLNNFLPIVEVGEELYSANGNLEDEIIMREERKEFLEKMSTYLSSYEFIVTVMYIDGMKISQIAKALKRSDKSINNTITRSKRKLQKKYTEGK